MTDKKMKAQSKGARTIFDIIAFFLFIIGIFIVVSDATKGIYNVKDLTLGIELQLIGLGIYVINKK
jgi:hypothetical protein